MARPLRIQYGGAVYHVTSRGNARRPIFTNKVDRELFLNILGKVSKRYHWLCHAYCLMNNHYHLVIETPEGNLSHGMRQLNGVYTQSFNRRHHRVGHVLQGRYKAIVVDKESHLREVCRYVVLNPVRAKAVEHPQAWAWSSYHGTAGLEKAHSCLTTDWILGQFGTRRGDAERRYRDFVGAGVGEGPIWRDLKGQCLLGGEGFVDRLSRYLKGREPIQEIPKHQRYLSRPALASLFSDKVKLDKPRRNRAIVKAVEAYGYSQKDVADYLGMHYATISRLVNRKS